MYPFPAGSKQMMFMARTFSFEKQRRGEQKAKKKRDKTPEQYKVHDILIAAAVILIINSSG